MAGFTTQFMTPYALALNASTHMIAALSSVPELFGNFFQLFSSTALHWIKDRKKIIVICSLLQAFVWLPILLIPYFLWKSVYVLIVLVTLHATCNLFQAPIWNSTMGDLVPEHKRGEFFGQRNKIVGIASFYATLIAGIILSVFQANIFFGFSMLFGAAFVSRLAAAGFKSVQYNPPLDIEKEEPLTLFQFILNMEKTNYGMFVLFMMCFKFFVSMATPFFAVYLLKDIQFDYLHYTLIESAALIANFISMDIWGGSIDKRGTKLVLMVASLLIPLVPFLWIISTNFYYLLAIEIFSGIVWAGFNLSASNFIFDCVKPENRVKCISYYNFLTGAAVFLGITVGGFLVDLLPRLMFVSSIPLVFIISGIGRLGMALLFIPKLKEVRLIEVDFGHTFFKRFITIKPSEGMIYEVIGKYKKQLPPSQPMLIKKPKETYHEKSQNIFFSERHTTDVIKEMKKFK